MSRAAPRAALGVVRRGAARGAARRISDLVLHDDPERTAGPLLRPVPGGPCRATARHGGRSVQRSPGWRPVPTGPSRKPASAPRPTRRKVRSGPTAVQAVFSQRGGAAARLRRGGEISVPQVRCGISQEHLLTAQAVGNAWGRAKTQAYIRIRPSEKRHHIRTTWWRQLLERSDVG